MLKNELKKPKSSLQYMLAKKTNLDEILGAQSVRNEHQELGYDRQKPQIKSTTAPSTSSTKLATKLRRPKISMPRPLKVRSPTPCIQLSGMASLETYTRDSRDKFVPTCLYCGGLGHIKPH